MDQHEPTVRIFDWISIGAIFFGPILAVFVTRFVDWLRERKARRLEIFKVLMRTRGSRLNPEHVGALNLIEIEYYKNKRVVNALEKYFEHLNAHQPNPDIWLKHSDHFLTKLLYEMAKSLGYKIEQLQILTGAYAPRGWQENESRQTEISARFLKLLKGEAALSIRTGAINPSNEMPPVNFEVPPGFPPPPSETAF